MKTTDFKKGDMNQLMDVVGDLVDAQRGLGIKALNLLGAGLGSLVRSALEQATSQKTASCCDIPEPCWMPKSLGELQCSLCPGASGSLRFTVTNEDIQNRQVVALASGSGGSYVSFTPQSIMLGPKQRGIITARFTPPAQAKSGQDWEALVWLRGCRDYYARWTITATNATQPCCLELSVADGPDHILHWYDHFYCPRPCRKGNVG